MKVPMRNPKTGEFKEVKLGWSWTLFLFSGVFGLPLFMRRLNVWGGVFLALWAINMIGPQLMPPVEAEIATWVFLCIFIGLQIFMGAKGNEMTGKNYLEQGWVFSDPGSDVTRTAKIRWGITL